VIYTARSGIALYDLLNHTSHFVTTDARDRTPVFSPDGSRVAVSYWQDGNWEVYTMNADGSNRQRLTHTPITVIVEQTELRTEFLYGKERFVPRENPHWNNAAPAWSPDGTQIAFMTDRSGKWEIWIMNADGSNQRPMFPNGALNGHGLNYAGVDERMISWR
jgi:Tol biopolymer transport system component